jgi:hypothetical protein
MKKIYKNKILQQIVAFSLIGSTFGCQWVMTHPQEDAEIVSLAEEAAKDIYKFEQGLTPAEPVNPVVYQPPAQ